MKLVGTALFLALIPLLVLSSTAFSAAGAKEKEDAALKAARSWLVLLDGGHYQRSWEEASGFFQSQVPEKEWISKISHLRPLFGPVEGRSLLKAKYLTSVPGAPDGEYVLILFKTSFEKKQNAVETVTAMRDADGVWRVVGYFIR